MTLDVFDFPYHLVRNKYPDNSVRMAFGGGYEFAAVPPAPPQRIFTLTFVGMVKYGTDGSLDLTTDPKKNYGKLEKFYRDHQLYVPFTYFHVDFGNLTVRFSAPFDGPRGMPGGYGVMESFDIELKEQLV